MNDTATQTRQLSVEMQVDIPQIFAGRLWAYAPVMVAGGFGLGVAVANEKGYFPIHSWHYRVDSYNDAQAEPPGDHDGRSERAAAEIILSTMGGSA